MLSRLLQKWLNITVFYQLPTNQLIISFIGQLAIPLGTCKEANSKPDSEGNMHVHEHWCRITGSYIKCLTALLECFEVCT